MMDSFVDFASSELGIKSLPQIKIDNSTERSFGGYNPSTKQIVTSTINRHPMDIFRTIAHELVHHKQGEDGRIGNDIAQEGSTGSEIENEANARAGIIMRNYAKMNPHHFKLPTVSESFLTEGVNDPGIFKAVFLAGGPGSGKDFVMNQTLSNTGLVEINSDTAFEFLMKKQGLNPMMPKSEEMERNMVRGRAKTITKEREKLALQGRLGLVINGTADSAEKIEMIKNKLEDLGYETMMLFVNTSNEVSQARNIERGRRGGRKVPDGTDERGIPDGSPDIRLQKWIEAQKNKDIFADMFGKRNFVSFDNSVDMRTAPLDVVKKTKDEFLKLFKKMQRFTTAKIENPIAKQWIKDEKVRQQQVAYETTPKNYQYGQDVVPLTTPPADVEFSFQASPKPIASVSQPSAQTQVKKPVSNVPTSSETDQAKSMGLSYYGFGRYGKNINGVNTVTHISQDGKLVPKPQKLNEHKISINEIFSVPGGTRSKPMTDYLSSNEPYSKFEPELYDHTLVFSTKTHDVYWKRHPYSGNNTVIRGTYVAVNKKSGRADIKVEGMISRHSNGKTQTFKVSDLESRENSPIKAYDFYSHLLNNTHDGRGTIIQSDNVQTLGGEKTWRRLAKKKNIEMHSWDDTEDVAQDFVPNKPEDREHLYSTGSIDQNFSKEIDQVRRKLGNPQSITDKDYKGAVEVHRKSLISGMEAASKLEKLSLNRTLVAYNPKTLSSLKEEKHVVTNGETIARIAMNHNKSPVLIAKENGLSTIHEPLKKDQELTIPKMPKQKEENFKPEPIVMSGVIPPKAPPSEKNVVKARVSKALQSALNAYGRKKLSEESDPKNPELWSRAKSLAKQKFEVYPSKYANQWASKWYKQQGGEWKNVEESNTTDSREWGTSSLVKIYKKDTPGEYVKEAVPLGYEFGSQGIGDEYGIVKSPTGLGMGYSVPMSESPDKGTDSMGLWSGPKAETDKDILETKKHLIRVARIHK